MDVKLPKLGEGADSGVVVNVFVKEGDTVAKGQAILELENEKAVASIPVHRGGRGRQNSCQARRQNQRGPAPDFVELKAVSHPPSLRPRPNAAAAAAARRRRHE